MAKTTVRGAQISDGANGVDLTVDVTGILPATNGGTNIASYTIGNYLNAATTTTLQQRTPAQVVSDIGAVDTTSTQAIGGVKTMTASAFRVGQGSGIEAIYINGGAGSISALFMQSSGNNRWVFGKNSDAETGSNAGSSFTLIAYDDSGASLGTVFNVPRSTRVLDFIQTPTVGGSAVLTAAGGIAWTSVTGKPTTVSGLALTDLTSGTYTPTAAGVANIQSITVGTFHYIRVGNEVSFSGYVTVDPTAANTITTLTLTLPISSTLGDATEDAAGTATPAGATGVYGFVRSNGAGKLFVQVVTNTSAAQTWRVTGHYTVN